MKTLNAFVILLTKKGAKITAQAKNLGGLRYENLYLIYARNFHDCNWGLVSIDGYEEPFGIAQFVKVTVPRFYDKGG